MRVQIFVINVETEELDEPVNPLEIANILNKSMDYQMTEVVEVIQEEEKEVKGCNTCHYEDNCMIQEIQGAVTCEKMYRPKEGDDGE